MVLFRLQKKREKRTSKSRENRERKIMSKETQIKMILDQLDGVRAIFALEERYLGMIADEVITKEFLKNLLATVVKRPECSRAIVYRNVDTVKSGIEIKIFILDPHAKPFRPHAYKDPNAAAQLNLLLNDRFGSSMEFVENPQQICGCETSIKQFFTKPNSTGNTDPLPLHNQEEDGDVLITLYFV